MHALTPELPGLADGVLDGGRKAAGLFERHQAQQVPISAAHLADALAETGREADVKRKVMTSVVFGRNPGAESERLENSDSTVFVQLPPDGAQRQLVRVENGAALVDEVQRGAWGGRHRLGGV